MNNWFECKVRYEKIDESTGKEKMITEPYLVEAVSFTEAEKRIYEEMEKYISGEFQVTSIKKEKLSDLFPVEDGDTWYKCKVTYVDVDEESGKEKKSNHNMLILANTLKHAVENLEESLKDILVPWELKTVSETPLMDVFPYFSEEAEKIPEHLKPVE